MKIKISSPNRSPAMARIPNRIVEILPKKARIKIKKAKVKKSLKDAKVQLEKSFKEIDRLGNKFNEENKIVKKMLAQGYERYAIMRFLNKKHGTSTKDAQRIITNLKLQQKPKGINPRTGVSGASYWSDTERVIGDTIQEMRKKYNIKGKK